MEETGRGDRRVVADEAGTAMALGGERKGNKGVKRRIGGEVVI